MKKEIIKSLLNNIEEEEIKTLEVVNNQRIRINDNIYWILDNEEANQEFFNYYRDLFNDLGENDYKKIFDIECDINDLDETIWEIMTYEGRGCLSAYDGEEIYLDNDYFAYIIE